MLHFCRRKIRVSSTTFTQWAPKATEFGEITQNNGHYAVQGHSMSPNVSGKTSPPRKLE